MTAWFKKRSGTVAGTAPRVLRTTVPDPFLNLQLDAAACHSFLRKLLAVFVVGGIQLSIGVAAEPATEEKEGQKARVLGEIEKDFIQIRNPQRLGVTRIPVERIFLGNHYKPNIARLPNNELRIIGLACEPHHDFYAKNEHPIFRSADGGRTWSKLAACEVGRWEPLLWTLKDGTLINTGGGPWTRDGGVHHIHWSEDGGRTWTSPRTAVTPTSDTWPLTRNVLEMADGSLLAGISEHVVNSKNFMWRSFDSGRTWSEKYPSHFEDLPENYPYMVIGEAYLWQARSGKIYTILRVGMFNSWPIEGTTDPGTNDHSMRMVVYSTTDIGHTWQQVGDLGGYGEYFPSILRLHDGRLLLTFTMREPFEPNVFPHGLRAVVGQETEDGFEFDLRHDRIVLDTKGPHGRNPVSWSGSIGGTVQVDDGTLVSVYAYGGYPDGNTSKNIDFDTEVIRWRLPEPEKG